MIPESQLTLSVIFALLSLLGYGLVDLLAFIMSKKVNSSRLPLWTTTLSIVFLSIGVYFFSLPAISYSSFALIVFASAVGVVALISFYKGLSEGKIAVVIPIANTWSIIPVLVGVFVLNEVLTGLEVCGIILAIFGTILVSFKLADIENLKFNKLAVGAKYALITMVGWGIYYTIVGVLSSQIGWYWPVFIAQIFVGIILLVYLLLSKKDISFPKHVSGMLILFAILLSLSFLFYNVSVSYGYVALSAPITGASPLVTVLLGVILLKEKLEKNQVAGIALILIGIILISA